MTVVKFTLLILAIAVVAYVAIKTPIRPVSETNSATTPSAPEDAMGLGQSPSATEPRHKTNGRDASSTSNCVVVYYFHMTARCGPCIRMEQWTKEAVLSGFPDAMRAGRLAWRAIDVEQPENDHLIDEYRLTDLSVVVAQTRGGEGTRYKVLKNTWSLLDDKRAFLKYIRSEVREYLLGT